MKVMDRTLKDKRLEILSDKLIRKGDLNDDDKRELDILLKYYIRISKYLSN